MSSISPTGSSPSPETEEAKSSTGPSAKAIALRLKVEKIQIPDKFGMVPSDYDFNNLSPFSPTKALKLMNQFFQTNG